MLSREITLDSPPAEVTVVTARLERPALRAMILGLLLGASILFSLYKENRAVQYGIDAAEGWSASQMKVVQSTIEEDPNLKKQYSEEQHILQQQALDLREKSVAARGAFVISAYAALLLFLGTTAAVIALAAKSVYAGYAGLVLGILGVALGIRALF